MLPEAVREPMVRHLAEVQGAAPRRSGTWVRSRGASRRPGAEVSERGSRVAVAVHVSCLPRLSRSPVRSAVALSPARVGHSARGHRGGAAVGHCEAGELSHLPALVRDAPAGGRLRHPHGARTARACGREHDDGVYARAEPRGIGGAEPCGHAVTEKRCGCRSVRRRARAAPPDAMPFWVRRLGSAISPCACRRTLRRLQRIRHCSSQPLILLLRRVGHVSIRPLRDLRGPGICAAAPNAARAGTSRGLLKK